MYRGGRRLWARARPRSGQGWSYLPTGWPAPDSYTGWNGHAVAQTYRDRWPAFREAMKGTGPFGVNHESPSDGSMRRDHVGAELLGITLSYVLARAAHQKSQVRVLDWGGALGHYALVARANLPELELDYHVKELPEVCAVGRELVPDVVFHDSDDCLDDTYDVVFASGVIEYIYDWQRQLSRLAGAAGQFVYLTRVAVVFGVRSFPCLQRLTTYGYTGALPFWAISRDELLATAESNGLALVRELMTGEEPVEILGAPEQPIHPGFLFVRMDA